MNWQRRLGKITTGLVALELVQGGGERLLIPGGATDGAERTG
jgi:hypothetical protein